MRLVWIVAFALSCAAPTKATDPLEISNQTTLTVTVSVNGSMVGSYPPGALGRIPPGGLPALPWSVEARTSTGRVITSMSVRAGDIAHSASTYQGAAVRADLSCGRLDIWSGPPMAGPAPGPGRPGDCTP